MPDYSDCVAEVNMKMSEKLNQRGIVIKRSKTRKAKKNIYQK